MSGFWRLTLGLTAVLVGVQIGRGLGSSFLPRLLGGTATSAG